MKLGQVSLVLLIFFSFILPSLSRAQFVATPIATPDKCVTSLQADSDGSFWVGSELDGIYHLGPKGNQLGQFNSKGGLGEDSVYALAIDAQNRLWAGLDRCGLSVFNRKEWKTFGLLEGIPGERVYCLAADRETGDIWIGTSGGLCRYQQSSRTWKTYTRSDGLPSDQIIAIAIDGQQRRIWVGTACDGLASSSSVSPSSWDMVKAPDPLPQEVTGDSLPSNQIHGLAIGPSGIMYVATDRGIAWSQIGQDWHYLLGEEAVSKKTESKAHETQALPENYVSAIFCDAGGNVWLGFRKKGIASFKDGQDPTSFAAVDLSTIQLDSPVTCFASTSDGVVAGTYGDGCINIVAGPSNGSASASVTNTQPLPAISAPLPEMSAPSLLELQANLNKIPPEGISQSVPPFAAFLGDDWITRGDWVGRYGRQGAILAAMASPYDQVLSWTNLKYQTEPGPLALPSDATRSWIHFSKTDQDRCLYSPLLGYRRQSEWDDHGEAYSMDKDGPDMWTHLAIPQGVYRLSLYFVNKDGRAASNRYRDFLIEIKSDGALTDVNSAPALAQARVFDFWHGVYKQFIVIGPATYWIHYSRNHSFNTICSGVFLDRLSGPSHFTDTSWLPFMEHAKYAPPVLPPVDSIQDNRLKIAIDLWNKVALLPTTMADLPYLRSSRLLAFRFVNAVGGAPSNLLSNWRWNLPIWSDEDRANFKTTMLLGYTNHQALKARLKAAVDLQLKTPSPSPSR